MAKLLYSRKLGDLECSLLRYEGELFAELYVKTDRRILNAVIEFDYSDDMLQSQLDSLAFAKHLDVKLQDANLVFRLKSPEDKISIIQDLGLDLLVEEEAPNEVIVENKETAIAKSNESAITLAAYSYKNMVQDLTVKLESTLMDHGGRVNIRLKRPKFTMNEDMEIVSFQKSSAQMKIIPQKIIEADLQIERREEENRLKSLTQAKIKKLELNENEVVAATSSALQIAKATNSTNYQMEEIKTTDLITRQKIQYNDQLARLSEALATHENERLRQNELIIKKLQTEVESEKNELEFRNMQAILNYEEETSESKNRLSNLQQEFLAQAQDFKRNLTSQEAGMKRQVEYAEAAKAEKIKRENERRKLEQELAAQRAKEVERMRIEQEEHRRRREAAFQEAKRVEAIRVENERLRIEAKHRAEQEAVQRHLNHEAYQRQQQRNRSSSGGCSLL